MNLKCSVVNILADAVVEIVRMPSWSEQESRRSLQYTTNQLRRRGAGDKTEESQEIIQRTDTGIGAIENIRNMAAPMEEKKRIQYLFCFL